jgi:ABC-type polysaccharide/polyol phosphate transport system ATPase subunit
MIKVQNGNLFFKNFYVLKDISLEIKTGERIAFVGHNGAGKSTLIDVLIGVKKLTKGSIMTNKCNTFTCFNFQRNVFKHIKIFKK